MAALSRTCHRPRSGECALRLCKRLFPLLALTVSLGAAASAAGDDTKPADPIPEGARLRLGSGRFRHGDAVSHILPLPGGKRLLALADDGQARVWDIAAAKELTRITLVDPPSSLIASLAPDGRALATAAWSDQTICVWSLADGKQLRASAAPPFNLDERLLDLAYSPDGNALVSSHRDGSLRVWDAATVKELRRFRVVDPSAPNVAYSGRVRFLPDGKGLALIADWGVLVLSAEDGKELRCFSGHTAPVAALAFSPDGRRVATVAGDRAAWCGTSPPARNWPGCRRRPAAAVT